MSISFGSGVPLPRQFFPSSGFEPPFPFPTGSGGLGFGPLISTETVTQTGLLTTSSGVSTNSSQSYISSATATSSGSTTLPLVSTPTTSSSSSSRLQIGPIVGAVVGGVVAALALVLLFMFLLLKHRRASQRAIHLHAEIPTADTREGLGRHVSVNDDRSRFEMPSPFVYSSQMPPASASMKSSQYTSDPNPQAEGQSNLNSLIITNGTITEEMTNTPTYTPGQSPNGTHLQTDSTNISADSDYAPNSAPPSYDESLLARISRLDSPESPRQDLQPIINSGVST